ncbi:hypothetical protein BDV95DRAFT_595488 [Massariosphaeria phaeospora]|uniref:Uncharacterized protein n=1 Tax=Massariosphaeria phaeospora TaxID=100035 RepID=A0A7C8I4Q4_9PLEO|nr:hypothetical protein BDV95DRAFT_595488 [Massariosphaeria phaeospora]
MATVLQTTPLLALPPELRNRIYDFYFDDEPAIALPHMSRSPMALAMTCRHLYRETHPLALRTTTFKVRGYVRKDLRSSFRMMPPAFRRLVKRLELEVSANAVVKAHSMTFKGIGFADVGLTGVEELFLNYIGDPAVYQLGGVGIVDSLEMAVWKTVTKAGNEKLQHIRITHGLLYRMQDIGEFGRAMHWHRPPGWDTRHNLEEGRVFLFKMNKDGALPREVTVTPLYLKATWQNDFDPDPYHRGKHRILKRG